MSLKPQAIAEIPEETARVARAAFAKGNLYRKIRDTRELRAVLSDRKKTVDVLLELKRGSSQDAPQSNRFKSPRSSRRGKSAHLSFPFVHRRRGSAAGRRAGHKETRGRRSRC